MKRLCVVYKGSLRKVLNPSFVGTNCPVTAINDTQFNTEEIESNVLFVKEGSMFCDISTKKQYSEMNYKAQPGDICVSFTQYPKQRQKVKVKK